VDYVEASRVESQVQCRRVDHHLVALAHLAEQGRVGPGRAALAVDFDRQRGLGDDDPAPSFSRPLTPCRPPRR
jgi:hypothetical protein